MTLEGRHAFAQGRGRERFLKKAERDTMFEAQGASLAALYEQIKLVRMALERPLHMLRYRAAAADEFLFEETPSREPPEPAPLEVRLANGMIPKWRENGTKIREADQATVSPEPIDSLAQRGRVTLEANHIRRPYSGTERLVGTDLEEARIGVREVRARWANEVAAFIRSYASRKPQDAALAAASRLKELLPEQIDAQSPYLEVSQALGQFLDHMKGAEPVAGSLQEAKEGVTPSGTLAEIMSETGTSLRALAEARAATERAVLTADERIKELERAVNASLRAKDYRPWGTHRSFRVQGASVANSVNASLLAEHEVRDRLRAVYDGLTRLESNVRGINGHSAEYKTLSALTWFNEQAANLINSDVHIRETEKLLSEVETRRNAYDTLAKKAQEARQHHRQAKHLRSALKRQRLERSPKGVRAAETRRLEEERDQIEAALDAARNIRLGRKGQKVSWTETLATLGPLPPDVRARLEERKPTSKRQLIAYLEEAQQVIERVRQDMRRSSR